MGMRVAVLLGMRTRKSFAGMERFGPNARSV